MKVSDLGENGLLDLIRSWTVSASKQVSLGVGDDAAILAPSGNREIIVSTDAFLEGVHFTREIFAPDDIGHKAMAASLSDLAAMGAEAIAAFVDLTAREDEEIDFLRGVYQGMARIAGSCNVAIAGGDTTRGEFSLAITVVGYALGAPVRRDGAQPGDVVFVSGELGKSEAGRLLLNGEFTHDLPPAVRSTAERAHCNPLPRFDVSNFLMNLTHRVVDLDRSREELRPVRPTAMIDVSDGLGIDLWRLCDASRVGCRIEEARIPVDGAARQIALDTNRREIELAMSGGEDFELVFTIPSPDREVVEAAARKIRLDIRPIGVITAAEEGRSLLLKDGTIVEWPQSGYDHFAQEESG
jgi:thiamine-monophosphate kinase